jgi:hypothetical protein
MNYNNNDPYDMTRLQDSFLSLFDSFGGDTEASNIAYQYVAGAWRFISSSGAGDKLDLTFSSFDTVLDLIGGYVLERERLIYRLGTDEAMEYGIEDVIDTIKGYILLTVFCQLEENRRSPEFILEGDRICIKYFTDSGSVGVYDPVEAVCEVMNSMQLIRIGSVLKGNFDTEPLYAGLPFYEA